MMTNYLAQNLSQEQSAFGTLVANYDGYKRVLSPGATPTLTQSGWLAVLLQQQRYKAVQLATRRAHRTKMRASFWRAFAWALHARRLRTLADDLRAARTAAEHDPPNYFLAGSVSGACLYCHRP